MFVTNYAVLNNFVNFCMIVIVIFYDLDCSLDIHIVITALPWLS